MSYLVNPPPPKIGEKKKRNPLWTPYFGSCVSTRWRARFLFENDFYLLKRNDLESPFIFVLFFKRVNKIRKKTPSVTPYFGKDGL